MNLHHVSLLCFLTIFALSGCRATSVQPVIGIFSAAQPGSPSPLADEQEKGYNLVFNGSGTSLQKMGKTESTLQDETQKSIRGLVEDKNQPVVAIIGATSNEATTRTAALVNFFNVPMLIPTAGGDGLVPSTNQWAFRLSAPGSAYARYFFGDVLNKTRINSLELAPDTLANFKIAILYEQNTYGESAAVASAETAMQQLIDVDPEQSLYGMEIAVYGSFPDQTIDNERLTQLVSQVEAQNVQMVYLVTNNLSIASRLVQTFHAVYDVNELPLPLLVGQSGAFASQAFAQAPEAKDVIILRQQWNKERCPQNITSFYEAQAYGAAYLLDYAVRQVLGLPVDTALKLKKPSQIDTLAVFRENLRNQLKNSQLYVPCFGLVSFDNTGQNKELTFEFIRLESGAETNLTAADFLQVLKTRILLDE